MNRSGTINFMYSLQEVEVALDQHDWLLSDALYKMERFAEAHGLTSLTEWCKLEAEGYYGHNLTTEKANQDLSYRVIPVQWLDTNNRPAVLLGDATCYNRMPILNGVLEIEGYADKGMTVSFPNVASALSSPNLMTRLHPEHLKNLLMRVRHQARRRLHDNLPRIPDRSVLYATPNFSNLVHDADLSKILAHRWVEANLTFSAGAYLATVVLLGSILEGALLDTAEKNISQANRASSSPKKDGKVLLLREWGLDSLIQVAHECEWIKRDAKEFSVIVRHYRNFVHPNKEREQGITLDAGVCRVIWEIVIATLQ